MWLWCMGRQEAENDDISCICGRERELSAELCWVCNSPAVAKVELEVERASKERSVSRRTEKAAKEGELVDDRDYDLMGDEVEEEDAQSSASTSAAAATAQTSTTKKRSGKRKAEGPTDLSSPAPKASKVEKDETVATASRQASAAKKATPKRSRLKKVN